MSRNTKPMKGIHNQGSGTLKGAQRSRYTKIEKRGDVLKAPKLRTMTMY
jgi:hypothetical protein